MAISFNVEPYYDDFESVASGNTLSPKEQYQRILFRPGKAVQARELTQLQTTLQNQISSAGDNVFKDGSVVIPGGVHLHNDIDYVKLDSVNSACDTVAELVGSEFSDGTNKAKVIHAVLASGSDPITLFVQYTSGVVFADNATITATGGKSAEVKASAATGFGSIVAIEDGVYYIKKHFVTVKASVIVLAKYTKNVSFDIGLLVTEALVSSGEDSSLNDNATGTPNESAPGAHRYSITAALSSQAVNAATGNFVLVARLESGIITKNARSSDYNTLGDELARRTFDESGNYYVNPFPAIVKTHQAASPDATKLTLAVGPSKAYVRGYEITKLGTTNVDFNKARTSELVTDKLTEITHDNFIEVTAMTGVPDTTTFGKIAIENSSGTQIGTCRPRSIERVSGNGASSASRYRIHVFDVQLDLAKFPTGMAVAATLDDLEGTAAGSTLAATIASHNIGPDSLVYDLPYERIKTCNSQTDGSTDFNYRYETNRIIGSATVSGSGTATFTAVSAGEQFGSKALNTNWILINDTDATVGGEEVVAADITINNAASPPSVVIANLPSSANGDTVRLIAPVVRTLNQKTKTLSSNASTALNAGTDFSEILSANALGHADIYELVSVVETSGSADVTSNFNLDNGQRETHYDLGHITLKPDSNYTAAVALTVTYKYFSHSAGDFFTVDSYTGQVDYEDIPKFELQELRSAVDFRPRVSNAGGNYTGTGAQTAFAPTRFSQFETDLQFYLPRMDKIFLDSSGVFGVAAGVPDREPVAPDIPSDSMHLFTLSIPAYTISTDEVGINFVDQRRYTMRDIGRLDKRINQVEYYTALNFLETEAENKQILDGSNNPRLKAGYMVDGFANTRMSRSDSAEYRASVDIPHRCLRPSFAQGNAELAHHATSATVKTGDLVTLPYTHSAVISQTQHSGNINVNPYNVFNWTGSIVLSPSTDQWLDIERRPEVVINNDGEFDAMVAALQPQLGTVWGSWTTHWSGGGGGGGYEMQYTPGKMEGPRNSYRGRGSWSRVRTGGGGGGRVKSGKSRSGVQSTIAVETSRVNQGDRVVEVNFVPYMRSRLVHFSATRMKPSTTVYAFFDGTAVANFVNEAQPGHTPLVGINTVTAHPSGAGALTTDANGAVSGSFLIPNNASTNFTAGTKEFRLTSSSTNNEALTRTSATADYTAVGMIETRENVIISTRIPRVQRTNVSSGTVAYSDPLAQSFLFDKSMFITKLDLYFSSKDAGIPVQVQIREMVNGFPTQTVVPFSDVTLNPSSVNIDGTVTTFTFPSPVFLQDGIEYAFVILANSNDYTVKFAEVGGEDQNGNRISQQPYNGVLFKSANASTWTAEQGKDLAFIMHRAEFDTTTRNCVLRNTANPSRQLQANPLTTVVAAANADSTFTLAHRDHGHAAGDSVTLAGFAATNGFAAADLNDTHTIVSVARDSYTITVAAADHASATTAGNGGGTACQATQHLAWNTIKPIIEELVLPNTGTSYTIKDTAQGNGTTIGSTASALRANEDYTPLTPKVIKSGATHTVQLDVTFTSTNSYLSPVIDMERCSMITVGNRIDNQIYRALTGSINPTASTSVTGVNTLFTSELRVGNRILVSGEERTVATITSNTALTVTAAFTDVANDTSIQGYTEEHFSAGTNEAKYVTKIVELVNTSDGIKLIVDLNRPNNTFIDVYHKTGTTLSTFDSEPWVLAPNDLSVVSFTDGYNYNETVYTITPSSAFTLFSMKIVMRSTNTSDIPKVQQLRAIALQA